MKKNRVLWLLNHTALRKFELDQFSFLGFNEIFVPKKFPFDEENISADVDYSFDAGLSIPKDELNTLNAQDWYSSPTEEAWEIVNRNFDIAVFGFFPEQMKSVVRHFKGAVILRAFGLANGSSYSQLIYRFGGERLVRDIKALGRRFWFGAGYQHLHQIESSYLSKRNCFLPVGLTLRNTKDDWTGASQRIFFVCPWIGSSPYFGEVYRGFLKTFAEFPYTIGGAQPIGVQDPNVIGFVSQEQHERKMREHSVMFYHSREKNHIHFYPFEAIAAGVPLVFMGGGLLDTLGGEGLPGCCATIHDAKNKIKRVLTGDESLIQSIRKSQEVLLNAVHSENCATVWQSNFQRVLRELDEVRNEVAFRPAIRQKKVAVILPLAFKGGAHREAKLIAEAIHYGSREAGESVEVIFAHLDNEYEYSRDDFTNFPPEINLRPYKWKELDIAEACRAMRYAGYDDWEPDSKKYLIMDDGITQLADCDLWFFASDRIWAPILPLRPIVHMVHDYLQRYIPATMKLADRSFIDAVRAADKVFITTHITCRDTSQYAGVNPNALTKLPILSPVFAGAKIDAPALESDYFIWATEFMPHLDHERALQALEIYYEELGGNLRCMVTGVNTGVYTSSSLPHSQSILASLKNNKKLLCHLTFNGHLSSKDYYSLLAAAAFLWHPATVDNGTFCVVEAASLGIPSLSVDYPAMREIENKFQLRLKWQDVGNSRSMANALLEMEHHQEELRKGFPTSEELTSRARHQHADEYWKAVRECL